VSVTLVPLPAVGVALDELNEMLPVPSASGLWLQSVSDPASHESETGVAVAVPSSHADVPVPVLTLSGRVIVPPSVSVAPSRTEPARLNWRGTAPIRTGTGWRRVW
jgi:hypothetical protein